MAKFWGKKKKDFTAVVENDCNQNINIKKKKDENYENNEFIGFCDESVIFEAGEHICIKCRFVTKNLKDFKRHLNTKKHKKKPQKKPQTINKKKE